MLAVDRRVGGTNMKLNFRTIAVFALIAIAGLSQAVLAQSSRPPLKIDVPFAFDYGKQHFAAGPLNGLAPNN